MCYESRLAIRPLSWLIYKTIFGTNLFSILYEMATFPKPPLKTCCSVVKLPSKDVPWYRQVTPDVPNGEMASQLQAGAEQFSIPFLADAGEQEANITRGQKLAISLTAAPVFRPNNHVKSLNHLTHDKPTTSTCPMSFPQPAILDIELKKRKPRPTCRG
jgi:hypothetical protein